MVRCHTNLLPMNSQWQQDYAQGKPLWVEPCPLCCLNVRLRSNSRHLSSPDDLRIRCTRDHSPGPVFRLAIAYGTESTSACCPAVRMAACWRSARPTGGHGRSEAGRGAMALSVDAAA